MAVSTHELRFLLLKLKSMETFLSAPFFETRGAGDITCSMPLTIIKDLTSCYSHTPVSPTSWSGFVLPTLVCCRCRCLLYLLCCISLILRNTIMIVPMHAIRIENPNTATPLVTMVLLRKSTMTSPIPGTSVVVASVSS